MTEPYDIDFDTGEHLTAEDVVEQQNERIDELEEELRKLKNERKGMQRAQANTLQALYAERIEDLSSLDRAIRQDPRAWQLSIQRAVTAEWLDGVRKAALRLGYQIKVHR